MANMNELTGRLSHGALDERLCEIYGCNKNAAGYYSERFISAISGFESFFGQHQDIELFSAPGRTEICGNHTDHQHGCVVAASVCYDTIACVSKSDENIIRIKSEGHELCEVCLDSLEAVLDEKNNSRALIRGVAAGFFEKGYKIGGFDAYTTTNVLKGSGMSSSAAFEVLVGTIINELFCFGKESAVEIAKISQLSENVYFGKPSGLMDQLACAVGGIIAVDFKNIDCPEITKINYDFKKSEYCLCIIDTGADHADLTHEYAAIPKEMGEVSAFFGKKYLSEVPYVEFLDKLSVIKSAVSGRAILRAVHFFRETARAKELAAALKNENVCEFLKLVNESGRSSFMYLQNIVSLTRPEKQEVALCLALCERLLGNDGAFRVHGGGFAGTVQAFVPAEKAESFKKDIDKIFGNGRCHILAVRNYGAIRI
ncbi:MAG: galactokinase family protein [Oscillospiraceae bacterium]|jgi:galactokinase